MHFVELPVWHEQSGPFNELVNLDSVTAVRPFGENGSQFSSATGNMWVALPYEAVLRLIERLQDKLASLR